MRVPSDDELDDVAGLLVSRLSAVADRRQDELVRRAFLMRSLARLASEAQPVYEELRAIENGTWRPGWKPGG